MGRMATLALAGCLLLHAVPAGARSPRRAEARPARADSLGHVPIVLRGELLADRFGDPVACAGDVNGDGRDDLLVGAWASDALANEGGRAFLYLGSAGGLDTVPAWKRGSPHEKAHYGVSLAGVGDLDGDGYAEFIVGAGRDSVEQEGRAFLYRGGPAGPDTVPAWSGRGGTSYAWYGTSVASAGDLNGDGRPDVAIGAPNYPGPGGRPGAVFVYFGNGTTLAPAPTVLLGDLAGSWFGYSVASAGDVNADGYGDLVVGAVYASNPDTWEGRAYLYLGSASGLATTPAWVAEGDNPGASFGFSVGRAGDVNADGFDDVLVGAHHYDTTLVATLEGTGRAFLYYGGPGGLSSSAPWWITGRNPQAHLGRAVGFAGDVNGDGVDDMLVSTLRYSGTVFSEGRLEVFHGHPGTGPSTLADWAYSPGVRQLALGQAVAANMDLNGDGAIDIAAGTSGPSEDIALVDGWVYVILGTPGPLAVPPGAAGAPARLAPAPNPLRAGGPGTVRFTLGAAASVTLALYDAQGRERARLAEGRFEAGAHSVPLRAQGDAGEALAPGLYFVRIDADGRSRTAKLAIVR